MFFTKKSLDALIEISILKFQRSPAELGAMILSQQLEMSL